MTIMMKACTKMSDNFLSCARYSNFFPADRQELFVNYSWVCVWGGGGGEGGLVFRARVGGGYNFQKKLKVGGEVTFFDGKKGGTIFPFCIFIPPGDYTKKYIKG